jgi:DNA-binding Xre family transcriptional regulator
MPRRGRINGLPGFEHAISEKGIQRKFLARKLNVSYATLWKMVSGAMKRIDPAILRRMAELLDCTTDELLYPPSTTSANDSKTA